MNKSVVSFHLTMLLWLSFATAANANPRLDKAQRAYFVEVDAFVAKEVSVLFNKHTLLLKEIVQKSLSASSERVASIENSILKTLETTTRAPSYIDLMAQELRVNQALWAISDSEQESKKHFERFQNQIGRFNKEQLCEAVVQETSSARAPKYTSSL